MKENFKKLYLGNYIFGEDLFNNTKFLKYCVRMINNMFLTIEDCFPTMNIVFQSDNGKKAYRDLLDFVANYIYTIYYGDKTIDNDNINNTYCLMLHDNLFHKNYIGNLAIHNPVLQTFLTKKDFRLLHKKMLHIIGTNERLNYEEFSNVFDTCCLNEICKYVANYSLVNNIEIINTSDLYKCMPKNKLEYVSLIRNIIELFNYHLLDMTLSSYLSENNQLDFGNRDSLNYNVINNLREKNIKLENETIRLTDENKQLRENLQQEKNISYHLKQQIQKKENIATNEQLKEKIIELNKKNIKLEKQLLELKEKYENSKNVIPFEEKNEFIIEEIKECDIYKKYGFVIGNNLMLQNRLLTNFPNSIIITEQSKNFEVECIIFMTSFLSHSCYYKIKNICDSQNIPYLHCNFKNLEQIKSTIVDANVV